MQKPRNILFILLLLVAGVSRAQKAEVVLQYIDTYKSIAIEEMQRTGVPASIKLAQGIFETTAGTSWLVLQSSNHFGIKCKSTWTGESVKHDDDLKGECFRKYPTAADSYRDHSNFLRGNSRYAFLFDLDPTDYSAWAYGLKKAGYATNSKYPQALIKIIEDYHLQDYTLIAMGKMTAPTNEGMASTNGTTDAGSVIPAVVVETVEKKNNYPVGAFKINETKVVFALKGTSYLSIAKDFDVDLSKIFEFNECGRAEVLDQDQLVYLQRKRKTGLHETHVMQPGETLRDIAQEEGMRIESIRELNWLKDGETPAVGETISLQKKSASIPKLAIKEKYTLVPLTTRGNQN